MPFDTIGSALYTDRIISKINGVEHVTIVAMRTTYERVRFIFQKMFAAAELEFKEANASLSEAN